ncbi:MAG: 2OG-Fe(II) oxygenase [Rhodospirillales bacterium]|nr:2OG-Fe(II) oxygenase [Rhodospirillales bacterium]MDE2581721.1 2OG-Fe(II) oxygenase [Rhodospirillales bacterium]
MHYPPVTAPETIAAHFSAALRAARRDDWPYRHWKLTDVLPEAVCTALLAMPIVPPMLGPTDGTRNSYNDRRCFITPAMRRDYAVCAGLTDALQRPDVARLLAETCAIPAEGSYLRMEYMQDTDGAWLEPHRDIPEKLFSMVIYLCTGPEAAEWGTDIYDADRRWVGRSAAEFDSAVIFVPGPATWHGFEKRSIIGVRRLMEINYVRADWRDREQLADPERGIRVG